MVYSFYKPLAENDQNKVASLIKFYKKVYSIIAFSVAVIGLALVPFLNYIVNIDGPIPHLEIYYLFFVANTVISYLFVYKTSIINADQKNYITSKYQMWVNCGRTIFQSLFLLITRNYFVYLLIQGLAIFFINIIASRKADKLYPYIKKTSRELDKTERFAAYVTRKKRRLIIVSDNTLLKYRHDKQSTREGAFC